MDAHLESSYMPKPPELMLHPQGSSASLASAANSSTSKSGNKDLHTKYLAQLLRGSPEITQCQHTVPRVNRGAGRGNSRKILAPIKEPNGILLLHIEKGEI